MVPVRLTDPFRCITAIFNQGNDNPDIHGTGDTMTHVGFSWTHALVRYPFPSPMQAHSLNTHPYFQEFVKLAVAFTVELTA